MSGTWFAPDGTPRDPNAPTDGADSWVGTNDTDFGLDGNGDPTPAVAGGPGGDTMLGLDGNDVLAGGEDDDSLLGGDANDELQGGPGNDTLDGGAGDDFMDAQPGQDTMYGGSGSDTIVLNGAPDGYAVARVDGGWVFTDTELNFGDDGTDFVADDVEWITFNNNGSDPITLAAPCFVAGTRIMTARGEVPVESLRAGDLVVTLGLQGAWLRPVRWVGRRSVDCRRHRRPDAVRPVRIRAGALGPGVPWRDLVVSPDHALFVAGALVPAAALVDGDGVLRETGAGVVRYFHVELDAHDVLLAEGAAAESWLDCGHRTQFANGGLVVALHPEFGAAAPAGARPCAARVEAGPALDRIRLAIACARAGGAAQPPLRRHG